MSYTFAAPFWLLVLLLLPLVFWLRGRRRVPVRVVPFAAAWYRSAVAAPSRIPLWLSSLGLVLLAVALARPQRLEDRRVVNNHGYDLMLAIDLSTSMLAEDYERDSRRVNRLQTIQPIIKAFINERKGDRIGITVFAARAYTLAPLTTDHAWLGRQIERLHTGLVEDGTAIGDGLGVALSRLEQAAHIEGGRRAGAFVILLTDGENNQGMLKPEQAAAIATKRGIPVYTVGVGRSGNVPYPVFNREGQKIGHRLVRSVLDEGTLRKIAEETGGRYFRADADDMVSAAFKAIDSARKIEFQVKSHLLTTELFSWFAIPGALLVSLGLAAGKSSWHRFSRKNGKRVTGAEG